MRAPLSLHTAFRRAVIEVILRLVVLLMNLAIRLSESRGPILPIGELLSSSSTQSLPLATFYPAFSAFRLSHPIYGWRGRASSDSKGYSEASLPLHSGIKRV
jgi:hypothetical protein